MCDIGGKWERDNGERGPVAGGSRSIREVFSPSRHLQSPAACHPLGMPAAPGHCCQSEVDASTLPRITYNYSRVCVRQCVSTPQKHRTEPGRGGKSAESRRLVG